MSLTQRAMVTILWLAATAGVFVVSMMLGEGLAKQVVMVAGLSMVLTFLALLFILIAEAIAPFDPQAK